jgi:putative FmdB family regulatory protein
LVVLSGGRHQQHEAHKAFVGRHEEVAMPRYEFLCEKCQKPFELTMTISEQEKGKVRCQTCKSTRVVPQLGAFMGQTKKKS